MNRGHILNQLEQDVTKYHYDESSHASLFVQMNLSGYLSEVAITRVQLHSVVIKSYVSVNHSHFGDT